MPTESERRSVLHAVRLASLIQLDQVAARVGVDVDVVAAVLVDARARGWAVERTGRVAGWSLTAAGRDEGVRLLAAEVDQVDARQAVEAAYGTFLSVNRTFLEVCTRWQLRGGDVVNDHSDTDHDAAVLAELDELHDVVVDDVVARAATRLERFAGYRDRFVHARNRLRDGDLDWFTRPLIDSYHTVWFELHDDLLATLGRDRAAERRAVAAGASAAGFAEPMHTGPSGRGQTGGGGTLADPMAEE